MISVSIVIPTYNGEKYIKETINSCLNQSFNNIEIIVVDDCSTDGTVEILKAYGKKITFKKNKKNIGIVKTINKVTLGLESDFFILLGHDDVLSAKHIEVMVKEFDNDTVAVHCNSTVIDGDGKMVRVMWDDDIQKNKTNNYMFELSIHNFISSCGMLHKTVIFKNLNGWDEQYRHYGEWLFYVKELKYGNIKYTTKTRAFYRKHETNITNTFVEKSVKKSLYEYYSRCRESAYKGRKYSFRELVFFNLITLKYFIKKHSNDKFLKDIKFMLKGRFY